MCAVIIMQLEWENILSYILTFLYSIAHYIGIWIIGGLNFIIPQIVIPETLADPIGFLALLTGFLFLMQVARKLAWIIVIVGWVLIIVRIILVTFGY